MTAPTSSPYSSTTVAPRPPPQGSARWWVVLVVLVVGLVVVLAVVAVVLVTPRSPPRSTPLPPVDVFSQPAPSDSESPVERLPFRAAGGLREGVESQVFADFEYALARYRGGIEINLTRWINAAAASQYLQSLNDPTPSPGTNLHGNFEGQRWFTFTPSGGSVVARTVFAWQRGSWTFEVSALSESERNRVALEVATDQPEDLVVIVRTNFGNFTIGLNESSAPLTVTNLLDHVILGHYDGTSIHRVAADFVIQGGDLSAKGIPAAPVAWEDTGLTNSRYTVAMARIGDPNSPADSGTARSQFFINLVDNSAFLDSFSFPYVVFGYVIEGMSVVDTIGALPTNPPGDGAPTTPVTILSIAEA